MEILRFWLKTLIAYSKDYVLENTGLKFLALLITAVLWLSVASRPVSEVTLHNVPIELANLPKNPNLIPSKFDTLLATVTLRGPRDTLDNLKADELSVKADMAGVQPGVRVIPLKIDRNRIPSSIDSVQVDPETIHVTVEREVTKEAAIKPRFDGEPPAGYEVYSWKISPDHVQIVGAASQVKPIEDASTETVSLADKTAPFTQTVAVDIGQSNVNIGDGTRRAQLQVMVGETRKERVIRQVPVTISGGPARARVVPRYIDVRLLGPHTLVDQLRPSDIIATVQYPGPGEPEQVQPTITVVGDTAESTKIISSSPERIRIIR